MISCHGCFKCCRYSSVFVLKHEVERLRELNVPMHQIDGVHFITLKQDGYCPNLDENKKCSIYRDRPIACRIFPIYLLDRPDFSKQWVLFQYCPPKNCAVPTIGEQPNLSILKMLTFDLEKVLTPDEIEEMMRADAIMANRDFFEDGGNKFMPIMSAQKIGLNKSKLNFSPDLNHRFVSSNLSKI